jgi:hypothetical protein
MAKVSDRVLRLRERISDNLSPPSTFEIEPGETLLDLLMDGKIKGQVMMLPDGTIIADPNV